MDYILLNEQEKQKYSNDIISMMKESDNDFVPPLSARSSTLQSYLKGGCNSGDVLPYFNEMIKQEILAVIEDNKMLGFVSFKKDFTNDKITAKTLPNIYLSTLILAKVARGKGLTVKLYDHLFNTLYPDRSIFTRTWSTNFAHKKILGKFDFTELARIENDRGINIDTVYYSKIRTNL